MGILEFVDNERAGIVPRSLSYVFDYVAAQANVEMTVTLSFLQIYRETIQDLLALSTASPTNNQPVYNNPYSNRTANFYEDMNLVIREDPHKGFYVEGLQEYIVRNYAEAEALINLGLENRAIAPTLMNATSSRSHTVLTLTIEQRGLSDEVNSVLSTSTQRKVRVDAHTAVARTVRSKLLMVDLAGSERVRRTISKGTRLSEAKAINTSLSALGNVIAALADQQGAGARQRHIPYRDSKLTRLLQDSLGGTASTALVATIGPAPVNYNETLSTLLFATRCMAVKSNPVQHEEVDYADLCARLQAKVNQLETDLATRSNSEQEKYEAIIQDLNYQVRVRSVSCVDWLGACSWSVRMSERLWRWRRRALPRPRRHHCLRWSRKPPSISCCNTSIITWTRATNNFHWKIGWNNSTSVSIFPIAVTRKWTSITPLGSA